MTQPIVNVGILSAPKIEIVLNGKYRMNGRTITGEMTFDAESFDAEGSCEILPVDVGAYVSVKNVMIGKEFHWQRFETQDFIGDIHIVRSGENLVLINALLVEDYLKSVISSEMSATSSLELLKAHSVISRSWLLAQIYKTGHDAHSFPMTETDTERIRWYDRDDHDLFDVCADDHCQRYQGISRQTTDAVARAIEATYGEVLEYDGELCDARFSKCCGGVFEQFETCWEPVYKPYLSARADCPDENAFPDLTVEENAREWILSAPEAFCNTDDSRTISEVLNGYDKETTPDFYRWTVEYTADELSAIARDRSGIDFGTITEITPLERGTSGRISHLRIAGTKRTMEIGKELEIRRTLSRSHLYSSAFVVEKTDGGFRFRGAGWGHGVGLCQIGAAVMAAKGYGYRQILAHYYPGSQIIKEY